MDDLVETYPITGLTDDTEYTPITAAMSGQLSGVPPTPQPATAPQAPQGFSLGNFAHNNSGLLLAMAGGMGGDTPIGRTFQAASDHFKLQDQLKYKRDALDAMNKLRQDKLAQEKALQDAKIKELSARALKQGKPQVTPLANGAFSQVTWPDGRIELMSNDDAQSFLKGMKEMGIDGQILAAGVRADTAAPSASQQKLDQETRRALDGNNQQVERYKNASSIIDRMGAPELQALPGVAQLGQLFGTDAAGVQQKLAELKVDEAFANKAVNQGAITDFERGILLGPLPKDYADTNLWKQFINDRLAILQKIKAFNESEVARQDKPKTGVATAQQVITQRKQAYPGKAGQMPTAPSRPATPPERPSLDSFFAK